MYHFEKKTLTKEQSYKYLIYRENNQLRFTEFLMLLQQDETFRSFFLDLLSGVSFRAYQWETPPVTSSTTDQPFEFVIHNSPRIDLPPDPGPFRQYFSGNSDDEIAMFNNLGNDAKLIAPAPFQDLNYSHIGVFTDQAPAQQQHKLWQTTGRITKEMISDEPLWLNTAGGGVAWLHIRLDSRPKYYRHSSYRSIG